MNCSSVIQHVYGNHVPTLCKHVGGVLPYTGLDLALFVIVGFALVAMGYVIRRAAARG